MNISILVRFIHIEARKQCKSQTPDNTVFCSDVWQYKINSQYREKYVRTDKRILFKQNIYLKKCFFISNFPDFLAQMCDFSVFFVTF